MTRGVTYLASCGANNDIITIALCLVWDWNRSWLQGNVYASISCWGAGITCLWKYGGGLRDGTAVTFSLSSVWTIEVGWEELSDCMVLLLVVL